MIVMTPERMKEIVSKIEYKPNFTFSIDEKIGDLYPGLLVIRATPMDAYDRGRECPVYAKYNCFWNFDDRNNQDPTTETIFLDRIWEAVKEFELHGVAEWFKYDGVRVHDPHQG